MSGRRRAQSPSRCPTATPGSPRCWSRRSEGWPGPPSWCAAARRQFMPRRLCRPCASARCAAASSTSGPPTRTPPWAWRRPYGSSTSRSRRWRAASARRSAGSCARACERTSSTPTMSRRRASTSLRKWSSEVSEQWRSCPTTPRWHKSPRCSMLSGARSSSVRKRSTPSWRRCWIAAANFLARPEARTDEQDEARGQPMQASSRWRTSLGASLRH
mmetsp:Transcript_55481/g.180035  ORF Transcript_55481/g.180035 Transcript_55481/m.180035 type:complete len:216 (-) Transcript_55481:28-675(-)